MVDTFTPDALDQPAVDALALAVFVALAATLGALFELRATVIAGAVVIGAGGYALFRLIYALEAIASALDDASDRRSAEPPRGGPPRP